MKVIIQIFNHLALSIKFSADHVLKYFSYFSKKIGFNISCKLSPVETIHMKCQILFSGKNKKNINNSSSAELSLREIKVKAQKMLKTTQFAKCISIILNKL